MGIYTVQLKQHSRTDVTKDAGELNDCIVHGCKPEILRIVSGRRREVDFVAVCKHDDCSKIKESVEAVAASWNKWNPKLDTP